MEKCFGKINTMGKMSNPKNTILLITGGIGGETTEGILYYKLFKRFYPSHEIKLVVLYNLSKDFANSEDLFQLNTKRTLNPLGKIRNLLVWSKKITNIKKSVKPSITISLSDPSNLVNIISHFFYKNERIFLRLAGNMSNIKKHQGDIVFYEYIYKLLYRLFVKIFYNTKPKYVTFISKYSMHDLVKHFSFNQEKGIVIYNPIILDDIAKQSNEPIGDYEGIFNHPILITAGRLTKQKGQWYLLRIFKELKKEFPELKLLILGEGELKEYLTGLSMDLGLKTYVWDKDQLSENFDVYFLGFQKNPFKFIARSKLFVFPSLWEGFGNVLIESMACGTAVVSADCRSGPREILAPNTDFEYQTKEPEYAEYGILMPVFEVKFKRADEPLDEIERIWVKTLRELLKREELIEEYGNKALQRARDFDIEKIVKEWEKILNV